MKIKIDGDVWWLVLFIEDGTFGKEVEVDEETLNRWKHAFNEFDKVQTEMRKLYGE